MSDKIIGETRQVKITGERQDTITGERQDETVVAPMLQDNYTTICVVGVFQCDCRGRTFPYWLDDITWAALTIVFLPFFLGVEFE